MANSLGLDDDLDGVELVRDLEEAFDINIANNEAERLLNVGQLYDLLLNKLPPDQADRKCASAMTFYRVRRAMMNLHFGNNLTPASKLNFLESVGVKSSFKKIEQQSGLLLPRSVMTWTGGAGCFLILSAFLGALGFGLFYHVPLLSVPIGFCTLGIFVGYAAIRLDPGKLPQMCSTLGDLCHKAIPLNYGKLIGKGARHNRETLWDSLLELLSCYGLPKSEITRDTFFLQSQLQKRA